VDKKYLYRLSPPAFVNNIRNPLSGQIWQNKVRSGRLEEKLTVTVSVFFNFILMINTGTNYLFVLILVPGYYPARTIAPPESFNS